MSRNIHNSRLATPNPPPQSPSLYSHLVNPDTKNAGTSVQAVLAFAAFADVVIVVSTSLSIAVAVFVSLSVPVVETEVFRITFSSLTLFPSTVILSTEVVVEVARVQVTVQGGGVGELDAHVSQQLRLALALRLATAIMENAIESTNVIRFIA
ncbi:hypothetical protein K432DRAFT_405915 [Lepidopterella palustris CBS 459.81]|uniref:Uncharacterized protein n=1 Tax=Lepidopterella palustris CBS 459.81 TaxID=1314670 RepID=A0A8E2E8A6_9PEZI|nr:hypothetical protein K432DRAFT_405915 [Lepidopterella palustris CBS 459.81]